MIITVVILKSSVSFFFPSLYVFTYVHMYVLFEIGPHVVSTGLCFCFIFHFL